MGARLGPVATDLHRAPLARAVARGVVERPTAVVCRADLDPVEALLDGDLGGSGGNETHSRSRAQLDLALNGQSHLYVDLPHLSALLATGHGPQVVTKLASLPEIARALLSEASVQALGAEPRPPAVDGVQRVRACLDVQRVDEPHNQVCGVAAHVQADEVTGSQHVTSVARLTVARGRCNWHHCFTGYQCRWPGSWRSSRCTRTSCQRFCLISTSTTWLPQPNAASSGPRRGASGRT